MDFRQYDNALGRYHSMDALAELAPGMTPYRFGFNNPVYWSDPTGLFESFEEAFKFLWNSGRNGTVENLGSSWAVYMPTGSSNYYDSYEMIGGELVYAMGIYQSNGGGGGSSGSSNGGFGPGGFGPGGGFGSGSGSGNRGGSIKIINDTANAIGIGMGAQEQLLGYAIAQNFQNARNPLAFARLSSAEQALRTTSALGTAGTKVLAVTKALGAISGVVQVGIKINEVSDKGYMTVRDGFDIGMNSAGVIAAVFFAATPAGWIIGGIALGYSIGTTIYDAANP